MVEVEEAVVDAADRHAGHADLAGPRDIGQRWAARVARSCAECCDDEPDRHHEREIDDADRPLVVAEQRDRQRVYDERERRLGADARDVGELALEQALSDVPVDRLIDSERITERREPEADGAGDTGRVEPAVAQRSHRGSRSHRGQACHAGGRGINRWITMAGST
ncbi:MAG: hypothetical protein M5U28_53080 [Sandaracinaceae bacterium]|nr:hypothetical protein [Sandaracinaceae bacterium]